MSKARDRWIEETQLQQRIAKVPISSYDVLWNDYDLMLKRRRERAFDRKQNRNDLGLISDAILGTKRNA